MTTTKPTEAEITAYDNDTLQQFLAERVEGWTDVRISTISNKLGGRRTANSDWVHCPDYPRDIGAAMTLLLEYGKNLEWELDTCMFSIPGQGASNGIHNMSWRTPTSLPVKSASPLQLQSSEGGSVKNDYIFHI